MEYVFTIISMLYWCGFSAYVMCVLLGCWEDKTTPRRKKRNIAVKAIMCAPAWFIVVALIKLRRKNNGSSETNEA